MILEKFRVRGRCQRFSPVNHVVRVHFIFHNYTFIHFYIITQIVNFLFKTKLYV